MTTKRVALSVLTALACVALSSCGSIQSLGGVFHHKSCSCESTCPTCESVPVGVPIGLPLAPGVLVPGPPPVVAPPMTSLKLGPEEVTETAPAEPALPPIEHPSPPPRKTEPPKAPTVDAPKTQTEAAPKTAILEPPPKMEVPPPPKLSPSPTPKDAARPGALTLKATCDKPVSAVGDELTFQITVENQGGAPIDSVSLKATLSKNIKPLSVSPEKSATIEGNVVTFQPIRNFTPMSLSFKIVARAQELDSGAGRIEVEATSPILMEGPLRQDASTRIISKSP